MAEQTGAGHHVQSRVAERLHHLLGSTHWEELVGFTPHHLHRHVDPSMQVLELAHQSRIETAEQFHRGGEVLLRTMERIEEELGEVAYFPGLKF